VTLLWSVIPTDVVFQTQATTSTPYQEVKIGNVTMLVQMELGGRARIERLISGNPQDYLRAKWQPGQYL